MRYTLYPDQEKGIQEIREALKKWLRVIAVSPTGSGKTVMFTEIAHAAVMKGKTVMVVVDTEELLAQAEEDMNNYDLFPTIIKGSKKFRTNSVYLASVQTLVKRTPPPVDLLIIDEGHVLRFFKVIDELYPKTPAIFFTATPVYHWTYSPHLRFGAIVEVATKSKLLELGRILPARTVAPKEAQIEAQDIKLVKNSQGEYDYDKKELFNRFDKPKVYGNIVDLYNKFVPGEKGIVFCVTVEHAKKTMQAFRDAGIECYCIDGAMDTWRRKQIVDDFKNPKRKFVLTNCQVATKGFNCKSLTFIIKAFSTVSYAKNSQVDGRGGRLCEEIGKKFFTIIDMGKNYIKHGFYEEDREFPLVIEKPKRGATGENVAPSKECPECEAIMYASAPSCKFCGYTFPVKEKTEIEADFEVVRAPLLVADKNANKPKFYQMTEEELIEYGRAHNYKEGWVFKQLSLRNS